MDYNEFAERIKAKYPEYNDMDNRELAEKMVAKFPDEYSDVTFNEFANMTPEQLQAYNDKVDAEARGNIGKAFLGAGLEAVSLLPVFNNPLGSTIGGGLFGAGDALLNNKPLDKEITKGATIGAAAFPLAKGVGKVSGKIANTKAGKKVIDAVSNSEIAKAVNEYLQNDIKNPVIEKIGNASKKVANSKVGKAVKATLGNEKLIPQIVGYPLKAANWAGKTYAKNVARLEPETIAQLVKPGSKALDLSKTEAQQLLNNVTQRVRNNYAELLQKKGDRVSRAVDKLPKDKTISIKQLDKDLRDVYSQYDKTGDKSINKAYNYVGKEYEDIAAALDAAKTPQAQIDRANFETNYQDFLDGTLNPREELQILSETPEVWLAQGLPNNKIITSQDALKKMGDIPNKYDTNHYLDEKIVNNLPDLLYDPNYILKSDTVDGRYMGILDALDTDGKPVAAILAPNEKNMGVTFIPSAYGRNNFDNFIQEQTQKGNLLYNKGALSPQVPATIARGENYAPKDIISDLPENVNVSGQKLYDIIKNLPETNWDSPNAKIKDAVLRQVYGKYNSRLSELSPELAAANKEYSYLMDFQDNDAVNQILRGDLYNNGKLGAAPTALKNYKTNITSGNKANNVQELENILVDNGYAPFLEDINDINAAQNLINSPETGINAKGGVDFAKLLTRPAFRVARWYNGTPIPAALETLKAPNSLVQRLLAPMTDQLIDGMLYGQVEKNDYR